MIPNFRQIQPVMVAAVHLAVVHMRPLLRQGIAVSMKGGDPRNLVTEADDASERLIQNILAEGCPGIAFHSEEQVKDGQQIDPDKWTFNVDPLDGSTNAAHGIPFGTVSIALVYKGETHMSVIGEIWDDRIYTSIVGQGSFCNGEKIHVSKRPLERALIYFDYPNVSIDPWRLDAILEIDAKVSRRVNNQRGMGSVIQGLCWVACGRLDGLYNLALQDWDAAAGQLLVKEAGGVVLDDRSMPWSPRGGLHGLVAHNGLLQPLVDIYFGAVARHRPAGS